KKYPNEPDALFAMAKTSYYSGNSDKAIEYYTKCYKLDNTYYHAIINRGFVKYQNKDYKGAIKDYTKAINMKYDNTSMAQAYGNRAIAKYFAGDLKSALKDYDKVFELEPNLPNIDQIHFNRGLCRYDLGDKAGADEDYKTARKLNPKRKYIYYDKRG
ncbi:tetratricopeptide repeat protein, partial [bacterium]|nr:tetratricopeptide repeat protein [bacterium]